MKSSFIKSGLLIVGIIVSSFTLQKVVENKQSKSSSNGFVVLELFTSQGCSSCPPADEVLAKYALQNNPKIIPLAFHVDYWNYIGWKDPFSKAQFTNRQRNYAIQLNTQGNYTPQLVINGKYELIGSYKSKIEDLVNKELELVSDYKISIKNVMVSNNQLDFEFDADKIPGTIVNLALVKKKEFTSIKRGENSGLKQISYNIVYDFKTEINYSESNNKIFFKFNPEWLPTDFMIVAYIQNTKNGIIKASSKSQIN
ncbi:MAG: DUF1223 domain-containing protein [Flavobacterium sp.]|uniref:DUF1223 domain-containing protein n=1 Tax=Flavobacterium sp. TaxID=239 RepID=UPI0032650D0C